MSGTDGTSEEDRQQAEKERGAIDRTTECADTEECPSPSTGTMQEKSVVPNKVNNISESDYRARIEFLEQQYGTINVHSLEKHGASTTGLAQYRRVKNIDYPNPTTGATGNPTKNASKFLTNKHHYEALRRAILEHKKDPTKTSIPVQFDRNIGVNIKNLGTHANRGPFSAQYVDKAVVRFDPNTGKFFTAYPTP